MKPKMYEILAKAVEEGVSYGYTRAHKHTDSPEAGLIKATIEDEVMNAICEVFSFEEKE